MNRENLIGRDNDPTVQYFNDLYANAKLTSILSRASIKHAYLEGIKEDKITRTQRVTEAVITEAMDGYDDDDIHRFFNRY